jgi:hypothetical protein
MLPSFITRHQLSPLEFFPLLHVVHESPYLLQNDIECVYLGGVLVKALIAQRNFLSLISATRTANFGEH